MSSLVRAVSLAVPLLAPLTAQAQWWCARPLAVSSVYSAYAPIIYGPVGRVAAYASPPALISARVCVPVPACGVVEPVSPSRPRPRVDEVPATPRTAAQATNKPIDDQCAITFWNRGDRDVTVRIEGRARLLRRGRGLTLDLPRQFVWQQGDQAPQTVQVSTGETRREIAIR
jgi:hypothetical protein